MAVRQEMVAIQPAETLSATGTTNSNAISSQEFDTISVTVSVTTITGTGASLTPTLQVSDDNGATWLTLATGTAITTATTQRLVAGPGTTNNVPIGSQVRLQFVVAGTTPSITFSANAVLKG